MILGENSGGSGAQAGTTLDDILRLNAARNPDVIALIDPPDREAFTDGEPRRLTFAQVDQIVSAIAARLRETGLPADSVVALQFPNTCESILSLLGIMRAKMIAAPMPVLWRRAECVAALARIGTKALITCRRIGDTDHAVLAKQVAAEIFSIRYVCGFGASLPEGLRSFDDLFLDRSPAPLEFDLRIIRLCMSRRSRSTRRRTASFQRRAAMPSFWRAACLRWRRAVCDRNRPCSRRCPPLPSPGSP